MADVEGMINDARSYAAGTQGQAQAQIVDAMGWISRIGNTIPIKIDSMPNLNVPAPPPLADIPEFQDIVPKEITAPEAARAALTIPTLDGLEAPVNTATAPVFVEPQKPSDFSEPSPQQPTVNTTFSFPAAPSLDLGLVPTTGAYTAPDAPAFVLPEFTSAAPGDAPVGPTDLNTQLAQAYSQQSPAMYAALSGQLDAFMVSMSPQHHNALATLEAKLAEFMQGGTALPAAVEDAIYARTRGKLDAEYRRARDTIYDEATKRGFTMPDGAVNSAMAQARIGASDNNAKAAAEIAVKQAELEQQNMQFAVTTSTTLRNAALQASISYHQNLVAINGQALDYAKAIVNALVQVYQAQVEAFRAKLDLYRADAAVYETRMRAVQTLADIYKAELEAYATAVRVDEVKMNIFRARVESMNSLVGVYRAQIDAVMATVNAEKLKVELFGEQVRAYAVQAQVKEAQWRGYAAAVSGQEARFSAYGREIDAYRAEVDAYQASIAAKKAEIEAVTATNEGAVREYVARVQGYSAQVSAEGQIASTKIDVQKTQLMAAAAQYQALDAQARVTQSYYQTAATLGIEKARVQSSLALSAAELYVKQIGSAAQTAISGAQVYQGLAAAALQGVNAIASAATSG